MKRYIKSSTHDREVILYHEGIVDPLRMRNSLMGVFFATAPDYFVEHPYITFQHEIQRYLLLPSANVWNPKADFEMFEPEGWDKIRCLKTDLDKFGVADEGDWKLNNTYGITSTDGLGFAGKRLGYDATIIPGVRYLHGTFDEYAIYNFNVIKLVRSDAL